MVKSCTSYGIIVLSVNKYRCAFLGNIAMNLLHLDGYSHHLKTALMRSNRGYYNNRVMQSSHQLATALKKNWLDSIVSSLRANRYFVLEIFGVNIGLLQIYWFEHICFLICVNIKTQQQSFFFFFAHKMQLQLYQVNWLLPPSADAVSGFCREGEWQRSTVNEEETWERWWSCTAELLANLRPDCWINRVFCFTLCECKSCNIL